MKRWMVAAALGLAVGSGIVAPGAAQASSTAWYQVYQARASGFFTDIAALGDNNIWAVGQTFTRTGKTINWPFIRHFNGSGWQAITIPHVTGFTSEWVSAPAANDVWVGGYNFNSATTSSVMYRWNGARWARVRVPALTLAGVVVLAANDVWAYGSSLTSPYSLFHWNGTRWRGYLRDSTNFVPQRISASSAHNVWVSGFASSGRKELAAAYRWNGSGWHAVRMPHPVLGEGSFVTAVSRSNVWIGYVTGTQSYALHWNGVGWHTVTGSYYANTANVVPDGQGGYWFGPQTILTGNSWTNETLPTFNGGFDAVHRIRGTTSFLLDADVQTGGGPATEHPAIFRFDL